jgi:hypothetical protein
MPRQRELAHPILDAHMEVRSRCRQLGLKPPSRNTAPAACQTLTAKPELSVDVIFAIAAICSGSSTFPALVIEIESLAGGLN